MDPKWAPPTHTPLHHRPPPWGGGGGLSNGLANGIARVALVRMGSEEVALSSGPPEGQPLGTTNRQLPPTANANLWYECQSTAPPPPRRTDNKRARGGQQQKPAERPSDQFVQRLLHQRLALRVQCACGLVQEEDLRPPQERPGDGQALLLPP